MQASSVGTAGFLGPDRSLCVDGAGPDTNLYDTVFRVAVDFAEKVGIRGNQRNASTQ